MYNNDRKLWRLIHMTKKTKNAPGVFNWLLTLILLGIPGVNVIAMVLYAICGKTVTKKKFAAAALILMVLTALAAFAVFVFLPDQVNTAIEWLRSAQTV